MRAAELRLFGEDGWHHRLLGGCGQTQIDEARARHFDRIDQALRARMREHRIGQLLGQLARVGAQRLGQLQREIAGEVAVRGDLRSLQGNLRLYLSLHRRAVGGGRCE